MTTPVKELHCPSIITLLLRNCDNPCQLPVWNVAFDWLVQKFIVKSPQDLQFNHLSNDAISLVSIKYALILQTDWARQWWYASSQSIFITMATFKFMIWFLQNLSTFYILQPNTVWNKNHYWHDPDKITALETLTSMSSRISICKQVRWNYISDEHWLILRLKLQEWWLKGLIELKYPNQNSILCL